MSGVRAPDVAAYLANTSQCPDNDSTLVSMLAGFSLDKLRCCQSGKLPQRRPEDQWLLQSLRNLQQYAFVETGP